MAHAGSNLLGRGGLNVSNQISQSGPDNALEPMGVYKKQTSTTL